MRKRGMRRERGVTKGRGGGGEAFINSQNGKETTKERKGNVK